MQQPTTDVVLHLPSSSSEEEEADQLSSPENPEVQLPIQSFKQLEIEVPIQIIKKYQPINVLHQTQKSIVVRCYKKRLQEQDVPEEFEKVIIKFSSEAVREGKILQEIQQHQDGKHIVKCLEIYEKAIVLESCEESLAYIIYSNKHLGNVFCLKLFTDFVDILSQLHKANIVHYDIKPSNILYRSKNGYISDFVLADFGNSIRLGAEAQHEQNKPLNQNIQSFQQSFQYYAPQSLAPENRRITQKCDMWALGCILFECLTGQTLLPTQADTPRSYWKLLQQIATENMIKVRLERFSFPSQIKLFGQLIYSLLKLNPEQRPSIQELKEKIEYLKARVS